MRSTILPVVLCFFVINTCLISNLLSQEQQYQEYCFNINVTFEDVTISSDTITFDVYYTSLNSPEDLCYIFKFADQDLVINFNPLAFDNPTNKAITSHFIENDSFGLNQFFTPSPAIIGENFIFNGPQMYSLTQYTPNIDTTPTKLFTLQLTGYNGLYNAGLMLDTLGPLNFTTDDPHHTNLASMDSSGDQAYFVHVLSSTPEIIIPHNGLDCVNKIYPSEGLDFVPLDTLFIWHKVANADQYFIKIGTDTFNSNLFTSFTTDTFVQVSNLPYETTIYWEVIALNDSTGWNNCGRSSFFTVYNPDGCMDTLAHNYSPYAESDNGNCEYCDDGILNGDEVQIDCGGTFCDPCPLDCTDDPSDNHLQTMLFRINSDEIAFKEGRIHLPLEVKTDSFESFLLRQLNFRFIYDKDQLSFNTIIPNVELDYNFNFSNYNTGPIFDLVSPRGIYMNILYNSNYFPQYTKTFEVNDEWNQLAMIVFEVQEVNSEIICPKFIFNMDCKGQYSITDSGFWGIFARKFIDPSSLSSVLVNSEIELFNFEYSETTGYTIEEHCIPINIKQGIELSSVEASNIEFLISEELKFSNDLKEHIIIHGDQSGFKTGYYNEDGFLLKFNPDIPFFPEENISIVVQEYDQYVADGDTIFTVSNHQWNVLCPVNKSSRGNLISAPLGISIGDSEIETVSNLWSADFNKDGLLDILLEGEGNTSGLLHLMINYQSPEASYDSILNFSIPGNNSKIRAIRDLNMDGYPDLIIQNQSPSFLCIGYNNGEGGFGFFTKTFIEPFELIELDDIDYDGDPDICISSNQGVTSLNKISFLENNNLQFNSIDDITLEIEPNGMLLVDFDEDGDLDVLVSSGEPGETNGLFRLYKNANGSYQFDSEITNETSAIVSGVRDLNEDGKAEIFSKNSSVTIELGEFDTLNIYQLSTLDFTDSKYLLADLSGNQNVELFFDKTNLDSTIYWEERIKNLDGTIENYVGHFGIEVPFMDRFVDVDNDGDLDLPFIKNGEVYLAKNVDCSVDCFRTEDYIFGSLRDAYHCAQDIDTILMLSNIFNDTIKLNDEVIIGKSLVIEGPDSATVHIINPTINKIFQVEYTYNVLFDNLSLIQSSNAPFEMISNIGNLTLRDMSFYRKKTAFFSLLKNQYGLGVIFFEGENIMREFD